MKKNSGNRIRMMFYVALLLLSTMVSASDMPASAQENPSPLTDVSPWTHVSPKTGGFFKIGVAYRFDDSLFYEEFSDVDMMISFRYQWRGLFVEYDDVFGSTESVGFNAYNAKYLSLDFIASSPLESSILDGDNDKGQFGRRENTSGKGLRITGIYGNNSIQFIALPYGTRADIDDYAYGSLFYIRNWMYRNWSFHGAVGAQYHSKGLTNYVYGVSAAQGNELTAPYQAEAATNIQLRAGVKYPINKRLLFESYVQYTDISNEISDSSLFDTNTDRNKNRHEVEFRIQYVF